MVGTRQSNDDRPIHIASKQQRRGAMNLLLTGKLHLRTDCTEQFLATLGRPMSALDQLWVIDDPSTGRSLAAAMVVPCPGNTAMLFVSPVRGPSRIEPTAQLVAHLLDQEQTRELGLVQTLIDPDADMLHRALVQANMQRLGELRYLQARINANDGPVTSLDDPQLRTLHYDRSVHAQFAAAIEASYEDTLDCPALIGRRNIDDIIAGHIAVGQFDPKLWSAYFDGDQPAAVLLLNQTIGGEAIELVYLGVSKSHRGRGLASRLMKRAIERAGSMGLDRMYVAVDSDNTPAIGLYRNLGFRTVTTRVAMIR